MNYQQLVKAVDAGQVGPGTRVNRRSTFWAGARQNGRVYSIGHSDEYGRYTVFVQWPDSLLAEPYEVESLEFPDNPTRRKRFEGFGAWISRRLQFS